MQSFRPPAYKPDRAFRRLYAFAYSCRVAHVCGRTAQGGTCFVHCAAGVSRSSTAICAYLMALLNLSYDDAICFVRTRRNIGAFAYNPRSVASLSQRCDLGPTPKPGITAKLAPIELAKLTSLSCLCSMPKSGLQVAITVIHVKWKSSGIYVYL